MGVTFVLETRDPPDLHEVEASLRNELLSICTEVGLNNNKQALSHISECVSDTNNITVMSYPTFNNFMNQKSQSRSGLKPAFRRGLQAFVSKHTALLADWQLLLSKMLRMTKANATIHSQARCSRLGLSIVRISSRLKGILLLKDGQDY
jgi:hypothetical protein